VAQKRKKGAARTPKKVRVTRVPAEALMIEGQCGTVEQAVALLRKVDYEPLRPVPQTKGTVSVTVALQQSRCPPK
jgi:hypothetical protein